MSEPQAGGPGPMGAPPVAPAAEGGPGVELPPGPSPGRVGAQPAAPAGTPQRRRRRWPLVACAVVVVALVAAGASFVVTRDRGPDYPSTWDPRVADLVRFVEREKDAEFDHPIRTVVLDEAAFDERLTTDEADLTDEDRRDLRRAEATMRALGLQGGEGSLFDQINTMHGGGVAGFYDPDGKEIVIPEASLAVLTTNATLVHELTHALQDQLDQLDQLDELDKSDDSDAAEAYDALVEGDAQRVESAWVEELDDDERAQYEKESANEADQAGADLKDVNPALLAMFAAKYPIGEAMVGVLEDRGRLDDAFDDPPNSTADVLDPARWLNPEEVVPVDAPGLRDGERADEDDDEDTFGAQVLYLMLATALDPADALDAVDAWGGDRMRSFEAADGATCVRVALAGVDDDATTLLGEAVAEWVTSRPDGVASSREVDGYVEFDACDRGAAGTPLTEEQANLPVGRAMLVTGFLQGGVRLNDATCSANGLIERVPVEWFALEELSDDQMRYVQTASTEVAEACTS